jgi:response regulator RpfG family c-di-GMP phosphodiesterase
MEDLAKVTLALARALRERDGNTGAHSDRTADLSLELGRACDLSTAELATLALAARLHDVGKIATLGADTTSSPPSSTRRNRLSHRSSSIITKASTERAIRTA